MVRTGGATYLLDPNEGCGKNSLEFSVSPLILRSPAVPLPAAFIHPLMSSRPAGCVTSPRPAAPPTSPGTAWPRSFGCWVGAPTPVAAATTFASSIGRGRTAGVYSVMACVRRSMLERR